MWAILILIVLLLVYYYTQHERMEHFTEFSKYGNISMADADLLALQHNDAAQLLPQDVSPSDPYDNSAVINQMISRQGPGVFMPNQRGVTATSYAGGYNGPFRGNFQLAEPGYNTPFMIPQTGTNADEMLARKQQHISSANKRAMDGAARSTRDVYTKYFRNELEENEGQEWWGAEADTFEEEYQ